MCVSIHYCYVNIRSWLHRDKVPVALIFLSVPLNHRRRRGHRERSLKECQSNFEGTKTIWKIWWNYISVCFMWGVMSLLAIIIFILLLSLFPFHFVAFFLFFINTPTIPPEPSIKKVFGIFLHLPKFMPFPLKFFNAKNWKCT